MSVLWWSLLVVSGWVPASVVTGLWLGPILAERA